MLKFQYSLVLILVLSCLSCLTLKAEENLDDQFIQLLHHEPSYFLMGKPNTKVQLSIKVQVLKSTPLYFSYTQRIFWDFFKESSPFRDLNYNPSFFYRINSGQSDHRHLEFIPYDHESNGKDGVNTRSWDRIGLRYKANFDLSDHLRIKWSAKLSYPYAFDDTCRDLKKYRGLYELQFSVSDLFGPFFEVNDLFLRMYPGGDSGINPLKGGRELTFRTRLKGVKYLGQIVFQIFEGRAENLLDYKEHTIGVRLGVGF